MDFYIKSKKSKYNTSFTLIKRNLNINTFSFTFNSMCSFSKSLYKIKVFSLSEIKKTDCNQR